MAENTNPELKPCPHCGGAGSITHNSVYWYGECTRCPAAVDGAFNGPTGRADAIAAWNSRPPNTDAEWFHEMWCGSMRAMRAIIAIEQYCRSLADKPDAVIAGEEQVSR